MADLVERDKAIEAFTSAKVMPCTADDRRYNQGISNCIALLKGMPSAQPEKRTEERTETHECDLVSRQAVIDTVAKSSFDLNDPDENWIMQDWIKEIPSAQPEIIRCNSCKYWTQSTGKMTGYGLGRCDFHDADLVTCNGFCYWAERRTDGSLGTS